MAHRLNMLKNHLVKYTPEMPASDYIFFGHDTVNRFSFLRDDETFLKQSLINPLTKFILFINENPLGYKDKIELYYSNYNELKPQVDEFIKLHEVQDLSVNDLKFVFLGIDERSKGFKYKQYEGIPYYAVDITQNKQLSDDFLSKFSHYKDRLSLIFKLNNFDASIFSQGRMYLDWLNRNKFCAGCGSKTIAIQAGTKLKCSSGEDSKCPVKNASVSNISFPRTDSVIITAITNEKYDKVLLGRGKRFPIPMYSCIAGFIEPSETIEVASIREVWEETGVKASKIQILQSQPWPYPANLMIGCVAFVEFNEVNENIDLGHDPELLDAKWLDIEQVRKLLNGEKGDFSLPPDTAIAHTLISHVVKQYDLLNSQKL
ncbi:NADH pyrophosphatase [Wickerhamomyces ciferrii]|uniref:NAD(+) diphosphatase n=1 Tax=Wickerhamomyces ciferrii (strain ATCC 14091 / BCRC 22168 / CBS 111 / JCM 3599 / NBRC 0793 / NRRL Y-1031 F-60-10) TaxID=1206466 RepID=K0KN57_WICCF|nr:NADH pyrophosphatase [Wickerhamomyces ciferrii]CCH44421.1 NADH pyrophosphatase [Wickerhamomyces ciferrii]